MKQLLMTLSFAVTVFVASAQTMTIINSSQCDVIFYLVAKAPNCSATTTTGSITIPPATTINLTFATAPWSVGTPPVGWEWAAFAGRNPCGAMSWGNKACPSPASANLNMVFVGHDCLDYTDQNCARMDNTCNGCNYIRCDWQDLGGGNIQVDIG